MLCGHRTAVLGVKGMNVLNKRTIIALILFLFTQGQAFMGSFYTATLYPKEKTNEIKNILKGKKFFLCSKDDEYNLVTEEKMDEQNPFAILEFIKNISTKMDKPIISYMIHDSDVLWFVVYKNGKQVFILDNTDEYFSDGEFILNGKEDIPLVFGIDNENWKNEISKEKFEECTFADEYLVKILKLLNLPEWVEGIGYTYLSEDEDFLSYLKKDGINIEKY